MQNSTTTVSVSVPERVIFAKGKNNAKLAKLEAYIREHASELGFTDNASVFGFSVPAGYTCPGAKDCLAFANRKTGKLTHGKEQKFTCFAAVLEQIYPSVRNNVWVNFEAVDGKSVDEIADTLESNLPMKASVIRVHIAGDFYTSEYFLGWMLVARRHPEIRFYAYTKSIRIWIDNRDSVPSNFSLTASLGGKYDSLAKEFDLKTAIVVFSEEQAKKLGLEIDHDDSHACFGTRSFALLIHGQQRAGSEAGKAVKALEKARKAKA